MPSCNSSGRGGFVLMEAVLALTIIALVGIALLATTAAQVRTADKSALLLVAQALAEERMATVRALGYEQLAALPDSLMAGVFPPPFHEYSWNAETALLPDEYDLFSIRIAVSVADEAFTMTGLLHEPQPQLAGSAPAQPAQGAR
jgi:type II secretory pathway pseudopilin PulG